MLKYVNILILRDFYFALPMWIELDY